MKKYHLREDTLIKRIGDSHLLMQTHDNELLLSDITKEDISFIDSFRDGVYLDQEEAIGERNKRIFVAMNQIRALRILEDKEEKKLGASFMDRNIQWLSHFTDDAYVLTDNVKKHHIIVLGCGGMGALILLHLVMSGFTNFSIYDNGVVDLPDLNRQYTFEITDIGKPKVYALKNRLERNYAEVKIEAYQENIAHTKQLDKIFAHPASFCICCIDTPPIYSDLIVAEACMRHKVPAYFSGVGLSYLQIGPLIDDMAFMQHYITYLRSQLQSNQHTISGQHPIKSSIGYTNSLCANLTAFEIFKYLTGIASPLTLNKPIEFDVMNWKFEDKSALILSQQN